MPASHQTNAPTSLKMPGTADWLWALAWFVLATAVLFLPSLLNSQSLDQPVLGHAYSDVWKHLWGAWHLQQQLLNGDFSLYTNLQNYPQGGSLFVIDPVNAGLTAVLALAMSWPTAYCFSLACQLILAGLATFALAYSLTGNRAAALIAGTAYGCSAFFLTSAVASGIAETAGTAWLPLALWGMIMCWRGEHPKAAVTIAAIGLLLSALSSWYYGLTTGVCCLLLAGQQIFFRAKKASSPLNWHLPITACLIAAIGVVGPALLFSQSLKGSDSLLGQIEVTNRRQSENLSFFHHKGEFKNNARLGSYFWPGKAALSTADDVDLRMKSVYIGEIICVLAFWGLLKRRTQVLSWILLGTLCAFLSLGPYLSLNWLQRLGFSTFPDHITNYIYMLAYLIVPGLNLAVITDRFSIAVQLCACITAGWGVAAVLEASSNLGRTGWGLIISAMIVGEIMLISPVPFPLPSASATPPDLALHLAENHSKLGLIELPLCRIGGNLQPGEYFYWQTLHRKPLPLALTTRFPAYMLNNRLLCTLLLCENPDYGTPPAATAFKESAKQLQHDKFGWICLHKKQMTAPAFAKANKLLNDLFGQPVVFSDQSCLYKIADP